MREIIYWQERVEVSGELFLLQRLFLITLKISAHNLKHCLLLFVILQVFPELSCIQLKVVATISMHLKLVLKTGLHLLNIELEYTYFLLDLLTFAFEPFLHQSKDSKTF